jgi:translation initiation factor 2B subunit (eIF-2B alpha/beta/delta family)
MGVLKRAADTKNFTVMVTEGRPEGSGESLTQSLGTYLRSHAANWYTQCGEIGG